MSRRKHDLNLQPGFDPLNPAHTSDPACWITGASADALRFGVTGGGGAHRSPEPGVWDLTQGLVAPLKTLPGRPLRPPQQSSRPIVQPTPAPAPSQESPSETRWQRARRQAGVWMRDVPSLAALTLNNASPAFQLQLPDDRSVSVLRMLQWRNNEDTSPAALAAGIRFQLEIALRRAFELFPLISTDPVLIAPQSDAHRLPAYTCVAGFADAGGAMHVCIWFQPEPGLPDAATCHRLAQHFSSRTAGTDRSTDGRATGAPRALRLPRLAESRHLTRPLRQALLQRFALDPAGIHGVAHWARVRHNALALAQETGADPQVVELFAFLHDLCRELDGHDPEHGPRAAKLAERLQGKHFRLRDEALWQLIEACHGHTDGRTHPDVTVQTCWDADRLDIGRIGAVPNPAYLQTPAARHPDFLNAAFARSLHWLALRAHR